MTANPVPREIAARAIFDDQYPNWHFDSEEGAACRRYADVALDAIGFDALAVQATETEELRMIGGKWFERNPCVHDFDPECARCNTKRRLIDHGTSPSQDAQEPQ